MFELNYLTKMISFIAYIFVISFMFFPHVRGNTDLNARICEPIRIEMCRGIGYNLTSMPNLVGHELQSDADFTLQTFSPLIQYSCSGQLLFFLCAAYVPMCTVKVPFPIGPCRGLCESVRTRCHPVLQGFGFPWPTALDCNRFPKANNHEHMCMEGPGEPEVGSIPPTSKAPIQPSCQMLSKSHLYIRLNRTSQCAPLCEADILFDSREKHTAEIWVTAWSVTTLCTAFMAMLCLIFSDTKWDKILMPMVACHTLVAVGWTVRWIAGRSATACGSQLAGVSILLTDGLSNVPCATNFLLRYYFGMSASVWWAILCLKWHFTVRRARNESLSESPPTKNKEVHGTITQLAAWGLPALQTVAVLVTRLVDAEELLGTCFVGNQSDRALRVLVAMPLFCYWIFGAVNLFAGYLIQRLKSSQVASNHPVTLNGMGTFLFTYCIPSALLMIAVFYEFANRDIWLSVPQPTAEPVSGVKAPMWPYMMRAFMELLVGVLASAWTLGPRISTFWKNKFGPKCKQTPQKFPSTNYSAPYQTVFPQTSMISMNKIPRHGRKYPNSYAGRKSRAYKTSTQSTSLTGHETVL